MSDQEEKRTMNIWNQENYIKAWNFASAAHQEQYMFGSKISYLNHLGLVAMEAMTAIVHAGGVNNPDLLVLSAVLHDTIEDTQTSQEELEGLFGSAVASGVQALSKNKNFSTKQEQMQDSLQRIKREPKEIWMVKLCDRITNLQSPPEHWNREKIKQYRTEAILIHQELNAASPYLANRLQEKIDDHLLFV